MARIVWIAHEANVSGANLCLLEYLRHLKLKGHDLLLVIPHKGIMELEAEKLGVPTKIIHFYTWICNENTSALKKLSIKKCFRNILAVYQFIICFIRFKPHFVCSNTVTSYVGAISSKLTFRKHYWFIHEYGKEDHGFDFILGKTITFKLISFLSKKVIVNSQNIFDHFVPYIKRKKLNIQYYLLQIEDLEKIKPDFQCIHSDRINLLLLGQISKAKGHLDIIEALTLMEEKNSFHLNIIGNITDQNYYNIILERINRGGLNNIVSISTYNPNPFGIIKAHDYLIMSSRNEAFGRVTLEALKLGVPVIAKRSGGTKEMVIDGLNGYFYDNLESLVSILISIVKNHKNSENLKKNAQAFVPEKFNMNHLSESFDLIFEEINI